MIVLNQVYQFKKHMVAITGFPEDGWYCARDEDYMHDREMSEGARNIKPVSVFEDYHIVKTWLTDPDGEDCSSVRTRLLKSKYLKSLINASVKKCPFLDFKGNKLFEGDFIKHPSGEIAEVVFDSSNEYPWRAKYNNEEITSNLALQVNDRGQAVKYISQLT